MKQNFLIFPMIPSMLKSNIPINFYLYDSEISLINLHCRVLFPQRPAAHVSVDIFTMIIIFSYQTIDIGM